ncbi:MAG: sodium:solute symporter [Vicinamibacteria bacterium]|jgi:SSS family transporter|nr:sodium:solute symporter [Vicinamibacteria bacterium]
MRPLDWFVLGTFLLFTIGFGLFKGRGARSLRTYMLADRAMPWYTVAFSVMATQASAITFLSTTGQGYADGMRFVQFYFGLPIAMVILCAVAVPAFHRMNVYTAYEFLESRFDLKTRVLTGAVFLMQRGLAASISLFAPAMILQVVLGWDIRVTIWAMGAVIVLYTAVGGVRSVNWNDSQQFMVIMGSMVLALIVILQLLPGDVSLGEAVSLAGVMGRFRVVDFSFDWQNRYNIWSGVIGGLFLALAYFGTDQSQVQRYLTGRSVAQSRLGLLFNGLAKVPMQFFILFVGVMVFVFYQFVTPPLFFNAQEVARIPAGAAREAYQGLENDYRRASDEKRALARAWLAASEEAPDVERAARARLIEAQRRSERIQEEARGLIAAHHPGANTNDTNYVFLTFVIRYLPAGLVGLIIVVVFAATMASTSSELNALATCTMVDIYKRLLHPRGSEAHDLLVSRLITAIWGVVIVSLSERASRLGTLVEAVNILGSLFYGTVLGIFVVAFGLSFVRGTATFAAALAAQALVLVLFFKAVPISFLWYNVIGCVAVVLAALALTVVFRAMGAVKKRGEA